MISQGNANSEAVDTFIRERRHLILLACSIVKNEALAEEIVQESWLRWHKKSYPEHKAKVIFRRIVANLAKDFYRRSAKEKSLLLNYDGRYETAPDGEVVCIARQDLVRVIKRLRKMPPRHVEAYRMFCADGLNCAEIGRRMKLSRARAYEIVQEAMLTVMLCLDE